MCNVIICMDVYHLYIYIFIYYILALDIYIYIYMSGGREGGMEGGRCVCVCVCVCTHTHTRWRHSIFCAIADFIFMMM